MIQLGGLIISGAIDWFKGRQEIKKVKQEGKVRIAEAETNARIKQISKESEQDHSINMAMIKNMDKSWKDEFVLIIISIPFTMLFIPELQEYAMSGLEAMGSTPLWYQILVLGVFFTIYGLRDVFKVVLQLLLNSFGTKKGK